MDYTSITRYSSIFLFVYTEYNRVNNFSIMETDSLKELVKYILIYYNSTKFIVTTIFVISSSKG